MNIVSGAVTAAVLLLVILVASCSSVTVVETGHRGIKTIFGKVEGEPLAEGIYFTSPFTTNIHQLDIRTQKLEDKTEIYTKDVQTANVQYAVNYSIKGESAGDLYRTVGSDYANKLIPQAVQGALKNATGKWEAMEVINHRENVRAEVENNLREILLPRGLNVEGFQLVDIAFTKAFSDAVEAKVVAVQKADEAKNQTVQVSEQAKQRVIAAQADAQAMKIKSDALSQNQNLVQYEAVQKWDGVLPVYMMSGATPFISIPTSKQ